MHIDRVRRFKPRPMPSELDLQIVRMKDVIVGPASVRHHHKMEHSEIDKPFVVAHVVTQFTLRVEHIKQQSEAIIDVCVVTVEVGRKAKPVGIKQASQSKNPLAHRNMIGYIEKR